MYCPKCGTHVADGSKFCPKCGNPLAAPEQPVENDAPQPPYGTGVGPEGAGAPVPPGTPVGSVGPDYRTIGGWLLVFLICYVVGGIYDIVNAIRYFDYARALGFVLNLSGLGWVTTCLVVVAIVTIVCAIVTFIFCYMAYQRNPAFLKVFEIYNIVLIIAMLVLASIYAVAGLDSLSLWASAIGSIVGFLLMVLYFSKSVRVQTYLGSDDYKREAPFTLGD